MKYFLLLITCSLFYAHAAFAEMDKPLFVEKRDPFIPLVDANGNLRRSFLKPQTEDLPMKFTLSGIGVIKGSYYAIIDGELVKEGQNFKDLKIEKIEPKRVILSFANKKFELRLQESEKKHEENYDK